MAAPAAPVSNDSSICMPSDARTTPSATTWSPRVQINDVVEYDLVHCYVTREAVANHPRPRCVEHGELVEGALRANLLHDADEGVADHNDAEQGVLQLPDGKDRSQQDAENEVEPGEDVRPQDLGEGSAGALAAGVCLPALHPIANVFGSESRAVSAGPLA